jgi:fatty acid CoA ligase FadD9
MAPIATGKTSCVMIGQRAAKLLIADNRLRDASNRRHNGRQGGTLSDNTWQDRLTQRIEDLYATDTQFAAARPDETVSAALEQPGLRLVDMMGIVTAGYADRPALGRRAIEFVTDPATGRTTSQLQPRFDTITYAQLWERVQSVGAALSDTVTAGDRVAILGFTSVDYTVFDMALMTLNAVSVPLQTGAPRAQLGVIVAETEPTVLAASVDNLADGVELALAATSVSRLVVLDYYERDDDHREAFEAAGARLADADSTVTLESLDGLRARGGSARLPGPPVGLDDNPLALLLYTSGSTGTPRGVMCLEGKVITSWRPATRHSWGQHRADPSIILSFMPMSHELGRGALFGCLSSGGTVYFAARTDLSTLLEDVALARPTQLTFVPRIWEMIYQQFQSEFARQTAGGADEHAVYVDVLGQIRRDVLGGRFITAMTGSAPISAELHAWVESLLDLHLVQGYGSTEAGAVFVDNEILRPAVFDYKLVDVPELGYFHTDQPYPRGELRVKSANMFPGYYKLPDVTADVFDADGFYMTGDIVAETAPEHVVYVDRRNNVLKLSQGEFVAVSKLEAVFGNAPLVRQVFVYANSARSYLLAVVVPTKDALAANTAEELKPKIAVSLQAAARDAELQSYEIPRDFIIEAMPFRLENGLLTGIGKLARPKLKEYYGPALEQLYTDLAEGQANELKAMRQSAADRPVLDTVVRAAGALLGAVTADLEPDAHFTDLGGDSLSALTFGNLLHEIFGADVPVGVIVSPASDLRTIAVFIDDQCNGANRRASFASIHGRDATEVHAADLTLDKFINTTTLTAAPTLPGPATEVRTVLLTGATGFLGRYLTLEWLQRLHSVDGKLICLIRAKSDPEARARLDATFDSGDPNLLAHYQALADGHIEVFAGDKGQSHLGLDQTTWQRLADIVDLIVDPAAQVNHVLPYSELFGPNTLGTAELIRIALTSKKKRYAFVSTIGVGDGLQPGTLTEDADIRQISATRAVDDSYANGYGNSKWGGEVLLREANDISGLPVSVFRCDMILAEPRYAGQLNLPDMLTRMMLSLLATGIAPYSFYELDVDGKRQRAHYDGLPVDFIAEAISTLSADNIDGFHTYHVMNPHDDRIGMDTFVDWLNEAGYPITRIDNYADWLARFNTALRALPDKKRQASLLPLLHNYQQPAVAMNGAMAPTDRFRAAVQDAKIGPNGDIPDVTVPVVVKYATDLQLLGLL